MTTDVRDYPPNALLLARDRDWIVIPSDEEDLVQFRPVGGVDEEAPGFCLPLGHHSKRPLQYPSPDPNSAGDLTGMPSFSDTFGLTPNSSVAIVVLNYPTHWRSYG